MLLVSRFSPKKVRITRETSHQRNIFVAPLVTQIQIVYASPGGEMDKAFR